MSQKVKEAEINSLLLVKLTADELRRIMDKKNNIRNVSVIGHVDHGKSTLTGSLVAAAGIIAQEVAGDVRMTDTPGTLFYYGYLINLIDTPGHVAFSSEVTAALCITDGALLVVDCIKGVCAQTKTVLRQALGERIRPVLTVNKMDRCFLELQLDGEKAYKTIQRIIEHANVIMETYKDPLLGDIMLYPEEGTVAFSAGLHGWAFTLLNFAEIYGSKFGVDKAKMLERLWGENYFDFATRKWTSKNTGTATCKRGFVQFCYEPIKQIINVCMNDQKDKLWPMLQKLNVAVKSDEKELIGEALVKRVMQTWLPASTTLLDMMIYHLPSPSTAQRYRVENLYEGPLDDQYANAIRNCDPDGPLMLYVSKMIPASDKGRFFAFGRVFAGKVSTGLKVRIMGPNYVPGEKKDLYVQSVERTVIWMGGTRQDTTVEDVPCGNTVAMVGLDQFIAKNATLTNEKEVDAHPFRAMKGLEGADDPATLPAATSGQAFPQGVFDHWDTMSSDPLDDAISIPFRCPICDALLDSAYNVDNILEHFEDCVKVDIRIHVSTEGAWYAAEEDLRIDRLFGLEDSSPTPVPLPLQMNEENVPGSSDDEEE